MRRTDSSRLYVVYSGYSLLNKHYDRWHNRPSLTPTSPRMNNQIEALFTTALGLQLPWHVAKVDLNVGKRRIDFEVGIKQTGIYSARPACWVEYHLTHDRVRHSWRHLDVFQFEAWLHAVVPRVQCSDCGRTTQLPVPWAHKRWGLTSPFESLCRELPVGRPANQMRVTPMPLWRRIRPHVELARSKDGMSGVLYVGIDEASFKSGHQYITVAHDLAAKRLLIPWLGRDHQTLKVFAEDIRALGGGSATIGHACIDMSTAYTKRIGQSLPYPQISYDRFHIVALHNAAVDEVRREEMRSAAAAVREAVGAHSKMTLRQLLWRMRKDSVSWTRAQLEATHWRQRLNLQSARAWRLKQALRLLYREARDSNTEAIALSALTKCMDWVRRLRLEPFNRPAAALKEHLGGGVRGMLDGFSNAYVEAMNSSLQREQAAAPGFCEPENLIAIAHLRMSTPEHLLKSPLVPTIARDYRRYRHITA